MLPPTDENVTMSPLQIVVAVDEVPLIVVLRVAAAATAGVVIVALTALLSSPVPLS